MLTAVQNTMAVCFATEARRKSSNGGIDSWPEFSFVRGHVVTNRWFWETYGLIATPEGFPIVNGQLPAAGTVTSNLRRWTNWKSVRTFSAWQSLNYLWMQEGCRQDRKYYCLRLVSYKFFYMWIHPYYGTEVSCSFSLLDWLCVW